MKSLRIFPLLALCMAIASISFAQVKTETIPVSGNCGMCKNTIESAAKHAGATKANWNVETKILSITYDNVATSALKIQQGIAAVGYDTRDVRADDKAYNKLHSCCKYERSSETKLACCSSEKCDKECSQKAGDPSTGCCQNGTCTAKS